MKDFDFRFKLHPITGDLVLKKNNGAITQSLRSIMMHAAGERKLNHNFGVGIKSLLFGTIDHFQVEFMKKKILTSISQYEQRISVVDLQLDEVEGSNSIFISLYYKLNQGGEVQNFSLTLERTL